MVDGGRLEMGQRPAVIDVRLYLNYNIGSNNNKSIGTIQIACEDQVQLKVSCRNIRTKNI